MVGFENTYWELGELLEWERKLLAEAAADASIALCELKAMKRKTDAEKQGQRT